MAKNNFKRMASGFVPVDEDAINAFKQYELGAIVTINLPSLKGINSGNSDELQRRAAQNSLMWAWFVDLEKTRVNEIAGTRRDEWHRFFRREFLLPIYIIDSEMWAMTAASLDIIKQNGTQQMYENAWSMILDAEGPSRLSTVDATVRQFSDYLRCIQSFCHSKGVSLRTDSRLLRLAFDNY